MISLVDSAMMIHSLQWIVFVLLSASTIAFMCKRKKKQLPAATKQIDAPKDAKNSELKAVPKKKKKVNDKKSKNEGISSAEVDRKKASKYEESTPDTMQFLKTTDGSKEEASSGKEAINAVENNTGGATVFHRSYEGLYKGEVSITAQCPNGKFSHVNHLDSIIKQIDGVYGKIPHEKEGKKQQCYMNKGSKTGAVMRLKQNCVRGSGFSISAKYEDFNVDQEKHLRLILEKMEVVFVDSAYEKNEKQKPGFEEQDSKESNLPKTEEDEKEVVNIAMYLSCDKDLFKNLGIPMNINFQ